MSYWDQYDNETTDGFEFVRFNEIGDKVRGRITALEEGEDFNGGPCPLITFATAEGTKKWSAGQAIAKRKLTEIRPEVGWTIEVRYSGNSEGKPGRNPAKMFEIEIIDKGSANSAPAQQTIATGADL